MRQRRRDHAAHYDMGAARLTTRFSGRRCCRGRGEARAVPSNFGAGSRNGLACFKFPLQNTTMGSSQHADSRLEPWQRSYRFRQASISLVVLLLTSLAGAAEPNVRADAEARRVLDETCAALAAPTSPEEAPSKNELATTLWASRVGAKLRVAAEVQAVGQLLRDLAASKYDWARYDAATQVSEFRTKWAPAYRLSSALTEAIVKLSADQQTPILSGLLVLPCAKRGVERRPVPIAWAYQQKPNHRTTASARVPGATITFVEFNSGFQNVTFQFDSGTLCLGSGEAAKQIFVICGTQAARYELSRKNGDTAFLLEWVTEPPP
jgi:hypothetical protein